MCDWSKWQFICEGRYDLVIAMLMGVALGSAASMMLFILARDRHDDRAADTVLPRRKAKDEDSTHPGKST